MTDSTDGIRADDGYRPRMILKDDNVNVWSTVIESVFREKKVWAHVQGTVLHPGPPLIVGAGFVPAIPAVPAVPAVQAAMGVAAAAGIPEVPMVPPVPGVTQGQADARQAAIEKWEVNEAKANTILLQTLRPVDVIAVRSLPTVAARWTKITADYVPKSTILAMNAKNKLWGFAMRHGDSVLQTKQRLESYVEGCTTQLVFPTPEEVSNILLTRPSPKWQGVCDSLATRNPLPSVAQIFTTMLGMEERWETREKETEHAEAAYASWQSKNSGGGGRGGASGSQVQPFGGGRGGRGDRRRPVGGANTSKRGACYCCEKYGHFARECQHRDKTCGTCGKVGHLAATCRGASAKEAEAGIAAAAPLDPKKKFVRRVSFSAKGGKKEQALAGAKFAEAYEEEGYSAEVVEVHVADFGVVQKLGEPVWIADSGTNRHICRDANMLWDIEEIPHPVVIRQLVGEVIATHWGTARLIFEDKEGEPVHVALANTLLVPKMAVNLFSQQKMRAASTTLEYPQHVGRVWMRNAAGRYVGSF